MKKQIRRKLAMFLAVCMIANSSGITVLADEAELGRGVPTEESGGTPSEESSMAEESSAAEESSDANFR